MIESYLWNEDAKSQLLLDANRMVKTVKMNSMRVGSPQPLSTNLEAKRKKLNPNRIVI